MAVEQEEGKKDNQELLRGTEMSGLDCDDGVIPHRMLNHTFR